MSANGEISMSNTLSFELQQRPNQNIKQLQRLIMSKQMQQAIHFLQKPIMELTPLIDMEMEQNPVLEYSKEREQDTDADSELQGLEEENFEESPEPDPEKELQFDDNDFEIMRRLDQDYRDHFSDAETISLKRTNEEDKLHTFLENSVVSEETLFEYLMRQATEVFEDKSQLEIAQAIIGNLDESGFLDVSLHEMALLENFTTEAIENVLKVIQTFDPVGIGARNLKESLLIQLKSQKKDEMLAYEIINNHFDDLLHNRIPSIKKSLHCTSEEISEAVDHITKLDLHPGRQLSHREISFITPDVSLREENEELIVAVNDDSMPKLRLNTRYLRMLEDTSLSEETKDFIKQKIVSAKWLLRNIIERNTTLEKISQSLAKWQRDFFLNPEGKLVPLTMKVLADELNLHESTIARAVSRKYIDTPRGLFPLRAFFTSSLSTNQGEVISSKTARDILQEIIAHEDKEHPFSDEAISSLIKERGIQCARRTVAKYREALKIGNTQQRRKFK